MRLLVEGLRLAYDGVAIFNDFNLDITSRYITVVKGKNGSGKTSFLRILAGLQETDSGSISFFDMNQEKAFLVKNITYLGHKLGIKDEFTVLENINFWHKFYKCDLNRDIYNNFGLSALDQIQVSKLSEGQKKKLALYRVLMLDKLILLLDEPLANLDEHAESYVKILLEDIRKKGKIIIVTSHSDLKIENQLIVNIDT
tara:strand:+ start:32251 stop:32847 length:597 start_codon:yes stop_codon:yes gene_type:complete